MDIHHGWGGEGKELLLTDVSVSKCWTTFNVPTPVLCSLSPQTSPHKSNKNYLGKHSLTHTLTQRPNSCLCAHGILCIYYFANLFLSVSLSFSLALYTSLVTRMPFLFLNFVLFCSYLFEEVQIARLCFLPKALAIALLFEVRRGENE